MTKIKIFSSKISQHTRRNEISQQVKHGEHYNTRINTVLFGGHENVQKHHSNTFQEMTCCPKMKSEVSRDLAITSLGVPQLKKDALFLSPPRLTHIHQLNKVLSKVQPVRTCGITWMENIFSRILLQVK